MLVYYMGLQTGRTWRNHSLRVAGICLAFTSFCGILSKMCQTKMILFFTITGMMHLTRAGNKGILRRVKKKVNVVAVLYIHMVKASLLFSVRL